MELVTTSTISPSTFTSPISPLVMKFVFGTFRYRPAFSLVFLTLSMISMISMRSSFVPAIRFVSSAYRPANRPAFGGTVPLFHQMSRVPLNHGNVPLFVRSRIFLAKIPNGTAAESPCYILERNSERNRRAVFWNAIDFCRLYTSKNINVGPANRPAFCRQVPLFYAKCPSKNILQVGRSARISNSLRTAYSCFFAYSLFVSFYVGISVVIRCISLRCYKSSTA